MGMPRLLYHARCILATVWCCRTVVAPAGAGLSHPRAGQVSDREYLLILIDESVERPPRPTGGVASASFSSSLAVEWMHTSGEHLCATCVGWGEEAVEPQALDMLPVSAFGRQPTVSIVMVLFMFFHCSWC